MGGFNKKRKENQRSTAEPLLFAGDYRAVLSRFFDKAEAKLRIADLPAVVGALCFLGRSEEAIALLKKREKELSPAALIECRFFLGLAALRVSRFRDAKSHFQSNYAELDRKPGGRAGFFIYQGLALYRFYTARNARKAAKEALAQALSGDFTYGRVLAGDLLAHVQIQKGMEDAGIAGLEQAVQLAAKLGNAGLVAAISTSVILRKARSGRLGIQATELLREHLKSAPFADTYSRANLCLEIARQEMLKGSLSEASHALKEALQQVYANGLKRQEAALNLAFAQLFYLQGRTTEALSFLSSARKDLHDERHHSLRRAADGLEAKLRRNLDLPPLPACESLDAAGDSVQRRMEGRALLKDSAQLTTSGDQVADLKDRAKLQIPGTVEAVLESGYLGILLDCLPISRGTESIALDLMPGTLTTFSMEGIHHVQLGKSRLTRNLLWNLSRGERSKEQLVSAVWGYEYHPLRHDPLIYSAVQAARKALGLHASWLEATEHGYRLKAGVRIQSFQAKVESKMEPLPVVNEQGSLNHRQILALRDLEENGTLNVEAYRKRFEVSKVTASRDLAELVEMKFVRRVGRARATHYMKG
ncbi:MAG TPA: DeoR family transcriptional regulator [Bdellovibrionota bacterium]|jgi:hypothetical protein